MLCGYKGDIFYFTRDPAKSDNFYEYIESGALYVKNGRVFAVGKYDELKNKYQQATIIDYSGRLIIPGLIDVHSHYSQTEMIASVGTQLLDWLNTYTFPTEKKFSNLEHAQYIAKFFIKELIKNGTTTATVYASVFPASVEAFFQAAADKNMRMISGKTLMDRNAPDYLLDDPMDAYTDSVKLIDKWHNLGRLKYAVTPRFAPTSTAEELMIAGRLLADYPDLYLQTHLAENKDEVQWVRSLFPDRRSYLDVYDRYGLVGDRSIFAHSIYLDDQDYKLLGQKGCAIAFCPSSNLFLGSGLFNLNKAVQNNISIAFGTDIGAGTSFSILETMKDAYKVVSLRKAFSENPKNEPNLDPFQAFYFATLGAAKALHLDNVIGSFDEGKEADFIVLDLNSTSLMAERAKNSKTLKDKLAALMLLGDDRAVLHTYIMGKKEK